MARPGKRALAILVDLLLALLAPLLVTRRRARESAPKVLVVRCDHLGDGVLATSVIGPIRSALKPARLDVLASPWNAEVFQGNPAVNTTRVIALPWWLAARGAPLRARVAAWFRLPREILAIRRERYDYAIDLRGDLRQIVFFLAFGGAAERISSDRTGGRRLLTRVVAHTPQGHEVERNAAIAGLVGAHGPWQLSVTDDSTHDLPEGDFVAVGLSTNKPNRRWLVERAAQLAKRLHEEAGLRSVYIGGETDRDDGEVFVSLAGSCAENWAGRTSIRQSVALLRRARAFLTIDSGQLHLGAAAGCPTVALFADSDPAAYAPWGITHKTLPESAPCGCHQPTCRFVAGSGRCMRELSVDEVFDTLQSVLDA